MELSNTPASTNGYTSHFNSQHPTSTPQHEVNGRHSSQQGSENTPLHHQSITQTISFTFFEPIYTIFRPMSSPSFDHLHGELDLDWADLDFDESLLLDAPLAPIHDYATPRIPKGKVIHSIRTSKPSVPKRSAASRGKKNKEKASQMEVGSTVTTFHLPQLDNINLVTAPNMSRRIKDLTFYAFPNFNKCDSLLYFPSTMARHLNSGDFPSLLELLNTHLHKNCNVHLLSGRTTSLNPGQFVNLFELSNEFYPDSVMCMHSTKVVDNEIRAKLYFKFTDNKAIYDSLVRRITGTAFAPHFLPVRSLQMLEAFNVNMAQEDKATICTLLDSDSEVVVYGSVDLHLSFDETTKRVMDVKFIAELSSVINANSAQPSLESFRV